MTITVYSTPGCVQCTATYRALDKAGLAYTRVDVAVDAAARAYVSEDLGYSRAPVVVVDDHDHWSGYRPDQIARVAQHADATPDQPQPNEGAAMTTTATTAQETTDE